MFPPAIPWLAGQLTTQRRGHPLVFADPTNGNYELVYPYWTDTYYGNLSGVDMNALNQAMNP